MESSQFDRDMVPTKESTQRNPSKLTSVKKRNADMIKVCVMKQIIFIAQSIFIANYTISNNHTIREKKNTLTNGKK